MSEQPATTSRVKAGFCGSPASPIFPLLAERFDRWLDRVRADARREGQAEALRQAAYVAGDVAPDGMGGNDWFPSGRSDHVAAWLEYRADRIENGADQ